MTDEQTELRHANGASDAEDSFAALFAASEGKAGNTLRVGSKIKGRIIAIEKDMVFVDAGAKIDGVVERSELLDENGELPFAEGDAIELYVVAHTGAEVKLSRALSGIGGLEMLREAYESGVPVEGRVKEQCKGGFTVEIMQRRAFCPISQIDSRFTENPEVHVGQQYRFRIVTFAERGGNIVVSRRQLLEVEQEEERKRFFEEVPMGQVVEGRVTRVAPFGVFIELRPGVEGMAHISELGWSRVENPEDLFRPGDVTKVKILSVEDGKKPGQIKMALSVKQTQDDPWTRVGEFFKVGDQVAGKVTRLAAFGAFVELMPGIEGLIHLSEMSYAKRVNKAEDMVAPGQEVLVAVKEVDPARRRLSLSLKDTAGDPWLEAADKYKVGQSVRGLVEKLEAFGIFVNLEPGVTGLMPKSEIAKSADAARFDKLKPGSPVDVVVAEVKPAERRMTLVPGDSREAEDWRTYLGNAQPAMGALGEKLFQAAQRKKNS